MNSIIRMEQTLTFESEGTQTLNFTDGSIIYKGEPVQQQFRHVLLTNDDTSQIAWTVDNEIIANSLTTEGCIILDVLDSKFITAELSINQLSLYKNSAGIVKIILYN